MVWKRVYSAADTKKQTAEGWKHSAQRRHLHSLRFLETTSSVKAVGVKEGASKQRKKEHRGEKNSNNIKDDTVLHPAKTKRFSSSGQRFMEAINLRMVCRGQH